MRAMRADGFRDYQDLKMVDIPKPRVSDGQVLVKITAAGVTPLEHTILSGGFPRAKAPLVLGSEGAGVVEDANASEFSVGARVMFTGPYGVSEDGAYSEYLAVRKENLSFDPREHRRCFCGGTSCGLPDRSYGAQPCWISGGQDSSFACHRRLGRQCRQHSWQGRWEPGTLCQRLRVM